MNEVIYPLDLDEKDYSRLLSKMEEPDANGCIMWKGKPSSNGYGMISVKGKSYLAHKLVYTITNHKQVGRKQVIRHKCDNKLCVNPRHLQVGSYRDNREDMVRRGRARVKENKIKQLTD